MTLSIDQLHLERDGVAHLDDLAMQFRPGQLTTVIGRTLAGKTTLLRTLAGLQAPDRGAIRLDGRSLADTPVWQRDVAMVYQQFINYPHLSVFENVAFPLRRRRMADAALRQRVAQMLEKVGLTGFEQRRPGQLSGGQQQRVALARALARGARLLLLDEPLVNLDYKLREQLRSEFRALLAGASDTIVVYTTTEPAEAMMLGDAVVVMHEGRILQAGAPAEVFDRPASTTVAEIVNDPPMNFLPGQVAEGALVLNGGPRMTLPVHLAQLPPGEYRFGIRAKDLHIDPSSGISGSLGFSEVSGSETFLHVDTAFGSVALQLEGIHDVELGARIPIGLSLQRLFAFAPAGQLVAAP
ncbi:ABC transporter ATP-binding protein [Aquabacterium sp. A7-Y]|uniref:ABC transporter ATP-binding protein n=1 Tax=Aquabacterium sp. A7-Y TaxID=1349605 RepID=UPI00223CC325|nr:ABC transporter ATP-binding protein [Aquabacterium sp. A7-Y]MCW7541355.1 ABC transporter ATP-binding protein [Aquabacterium sp. A7-Y]